jgi:putative MATE family efflux protein
MWLMGLLQGAAGVGATAVVAREIGRADRDRAEDAVGQAMTLAVIWGLINGVVFFAAAPLVAELFNLDDPLSKRMCIDYLRILALVAPLRAVLFIGAACLRGAGDTRSPFLVMLLVNAANIVASISLVLGAGLAVRGIALGTLVAWTVGGVAMVMLLHRGRGGVQLHLRRTRPHWPMMRRLIRVGIPALFESGGHWLGNLAVVAMVGYLAELGLNQAPLGSHNFAIRIEGYSFLPGFAFGIAAATLTGQYLGVNDQAGAKRAVFWSWLYGAGLMCLFGVIFITTPRTLVALVTDEQLFLDTTPRLLFYAGWAQLGFATALVLSGAIRGAGDTRATMAITFVSTFCVRLPAAYVLGIVLGWGLNGIWIALAAELTLRGLLFLIWFWRGTWTQKNV